VEAVIVDRTAVVVGGGERGCRRDELCWVVRWSHVSVLVAPVQLINT